MSELLDLVVGVCLSVNLNMNVCVCVFWLQTQRSVADTTPGPPIVSAFLISVSDCVCICYHQLLFDEIPFAPIVLPAA